MAGAEVGGSAVAKANQGIACMLIALGAPRATAIDGSVGGSRARFGGAPMKITTLGRARVVLAAVATAAASLAAAPAAAASGPPQTARSVVPSVAPSVAPQAYGTTLTIQGHGFGHGEGMGQYGAFGYATTYRWTWQQILAHYYGGTTLATTNPNQLLSVRLQALDDRPFTAFVQDKAALATNVDGGVGRFRSMVALETATPGVYNIYGRADAEVCPSYAAPFNATGWTLVKAGVISSSLQGRYADFAVVGVPTSTPDIGNLVGVCEPDASVVYYRGSLRAVNGTAGENRTVNLVPLDLYVQGVVPREMPASWGLSSGGAGMNALRAQAVAARTFAIAGGSRWSYARICDSQSCQVYGGVAKRGTVGAPLFALEQPTATTATANTSAVILERAGAPVFAMYSSSSGGVTAGTVFPAVVDAGDAVSPFHSWSVTVAVATIQAHWPSVGALQSIVVTKRNGLGEWGGRVQQLVLRGTAGAVVLTGDQFRVGLALRSNWFSVPDGCAGRAGGTPTPAPTPAMFHPVTPARVLDTRRGLNAAAARIGAGCVLAVHLAGLGGVPATGASAVTFNLTLTGAAGPGSVTVYPCSAGRPLASNANLVAGVAVPALVTVPLDGDGYVCIFVGQSTDVVIDVFGWYGGSSGLGYRPVVPARLLDTRTRAPRPAASRLSSPSPVGAGSPPAPPSAPWLSTSPRCAPAPTAGWRPIRATRRDRGRRT